jgi:hypothetical protein
METLSTLNWFATLFRLRYSLPVLCNTTRILTSGPVLADIDDVISFVNSRSGIPLVCSEQIFLAENMGFSTMRLFSTGPVLAISLSVAMIVGLMVCGISRYQTSSDSEYSATVGQNTVSVLFQNLDDADKEDEASALFHLAGGKKMLRTNLPDHFGDKELEHKNQDALNILSKFFHGGHQVSKEKGPNSNQHSFSTRGRAKDMIQPQSPASKAAEDDKSSPPSSQEKNPENKQLERMKMRSEADVSQEPPNEALQGLIAGWSGAGWWQPCAEVCRPTAGTKHTKANFKIYMDCEKKCRATKTEKLRQVMQHIRGAAEMAGGHKEMAPHTIQKLSKFLLKWAESNGLPPAVAAEANTNLADNEQAGESISGMLIAGWSGAGWWKPCGEVCRPGPDTPHTKANFDKFMACENACRKSKAEYLHGFLTPKAAVKALALAKQQAHSAPHTSAAPHPAHGAKPDDVSAEHSESHADQLRRHVHAAAVHSAHVKKAAAVAAAAHSSQVTAPAAASPAVPAAPAVAKPHLTKQQKLIRWAEAHGLPKKLVDNPADKLKVRPAVPAASLLRIHARIPPAFSILARAELLSVETVAPIPPSSDLLLRRHGFRALPDVQGLACLPCWAFLLSPHLRTL